MRFYLSYLLLLILYRWNLLGLNWRMLAWRRRHRVTWSWHRRRLSMHHRLRWHSIVRIPRSCAWRGLIITRTWWRHHISRRRGLIVVSLLVIRIHGRWLVVVVTRRRWHVCWATLWRMIMTTLSTSMMMSSSSISTTVMSSRSWLILLLGSIIKFHVF